MFDATPEFHDDTTKIIYLNNRGESIPCVIDDVDYQWASRWRWQAHWSKQKSKVYARRNVLIKKRTVGIYLHKEICLRTHGLPPTEKHIIGDHKDGKTLNCRRDNLRWATPSQNRLNLHGFYAKQLKLALDLDDIDMLLFGKEKFK